MDAEYFIRVIIEGRDNLTKSLASSTAAIQGLRGEVRALNAEMQKNSGGTDRASASATRFATSTRGARNESEAARRTARDLGADLESVEKRFVRAEGASNSWNNALRATARALYDTKRGVRDMSFALREAQGLNPFYDLARGADNAGKSFTRMNTIAAILAPLIFNLLGAILNLGAALVSVASAASMAAAAFGGALLSGLAQLVPVVGLLVASFKRLSLVMQANQYLTQGTGQSHAAAADQVKAHREAVQKLVDAQYGLTTAYQTVANAAYDVKQAETDLQNARKKAARDLVDIEFARSDAILSERDATLSLLEAKQNLKQTEQAAAGNKQDIAGLRNAVQQAKDNLAAAKASGNQAEIVGATAALGQATSELGYAQNANKNDLTVPRAKLGVAEAAQRLKEARVQQARSIQDAAKAQREQIARNPEVIRAEHALTQALQAQAAAAHELIKAQRELSDSKYDLAHPTGAAAGSKTLDPLQRVLNRLDPTEKDLLKTIQKFQKLWDMATRPLTDAILRAIGKALVQAETLFRDPKFMGALQGLANEIGRSIVGLAKFFTSPEQKHFFEQFANLAKQNLPIVVKILEGVVRLVERIAIAFAPVLHEILGRAAGDIGGWVAGMDKGAKAPPGYAQNKAGAFAARSETFLETFGKFTGAVLHFLGALIGVSAGAGKTALDDLTKWLNNLSKELSPGGSKYKGAKEFFDRSIKTTAEIFGLLGHLITVLFHLTQGSGFSDFIKVLDKGVVPGLDLAGQIYGKIFSALATLATLPGVGGVIKYLTALAILAKITPVPGLLFALGRKGLGGILMSAGDAAAGGGGGFSLREGLKSLFTGRPTGTSADPIKVIVENYNAVRTGSSSTIRTAEKDAQGAVKREGAFARAGRVIGKLTGIPVAGGVAAGVSGGGEAAGAAAAEGTVLSGGAALAPETLGISAAIAAAVAGMIALLNWTGKLGEVWKSLKSTVLGVIDALFIKTFAIIKDIWTGKWNALWRDVKKMFFELFVNPWKSQWVVLKDVVLSVWKAIQDSSTKLWGWLKTAFSTAASDIYSIIQSNFAWKYILSLGDTIWGGLQSAYKSVSGFLLTDIPKWAGKVWSALQSGLGNIVDTILSPLHFLWDKIRDVASWVGLDLPKWGGASTSQKGAHKTKTITQSTVHGPGGNVPGHEDGGIIQPVPGGVYRVAEAGHAEAIIPFDPKYRERARKILAATAQHLFGPNVPGFASGAIVGKMKEILSAARSQLGVPYQFGVEQPGVGFDCSSLAQFSYGRAGIGIGRDTYAQWGQSKHVDSKHLQPADLVFSQFGEGGLSGPGHVRIFVGGNEVIAAPHTGDVVRMQSLFDNYYTPGNQVGGRYLGDLKGGGGILSKALGWIGDAGSWITSLPGRAKGWIKNGILDVAGAIGLPTGLGPWPSAVLGTIKDAALNFIGNQITSLPGRAASIGGKIISGIGSVAGAAAGAASGAISGIGGALGFAQGGIAMPVMAHAGEWILNTMQQNTLARRLRMPPGKIKDWLFGRTPRVITDANSGAVARSYKKAQAAKAMLDKFGAHYFGPTISDWANPSLNPMSGREQHPNATGYDPVFVDTPRHEYVEAGRNVIGLLRKSHGFWLPDFVKRAGGFARASHAQIQAWKRSNVIAGLGAEGHRDWHANNLVNAIMNSPLWSYGTGGVVGFAPAADRVPSMASGGWITTPAVTGESRAANGVTQHFAIQTASPTIDVDYIMRVAKIHAETSY